ncbi:YncE family protein [Rosistilla oblonga]|uniref:YncE family protein n=1 Tax=Rosistilla oblonga TaxID=2527990 RepID=UPI003A98099F
MNISQSIVTLGLLGSFCFSVQADEKGSVLDGVSIQRYVPQSGSLPACTHIARHGEAEIVTSSDRLFYRTDSQSPLIRSPIDVLVDAHSVVFNPVEKLFYATDTGNHRLLTFADPSRPEWDTFATSLAGIKLQRPHDIVFDEATGWMYALNPNSSEVFRFKGSGGDVAVLDLSKHLGYSRALTIAGGTLYVIGSSHGVVVEVTDFEKQAFQIHTSFGKKKNAVAGSWQATGLVLNDVDYYQGHWYATSYFCPAYAGNEDCDEHKFIRFKTWDDLKTGKWDDLSSLLPSKVVPYFLTPHADGLDIAMFSHEARGTADWIYRLTLAVPESADP